MLRKLLILGIFAGGSASIPVIYQSNPHLFEQVMKSAVDNGQPIAEPPTTLSLTSAEPDPVQHPLGRKVLVPSDERGHFQAAFKINGRQINALIDTGATVVALNLSTARRAGISVSPSDFSHQVDTANGSVKVAVVKIADLAIGRIALKDVQAVVLDDKALQTNLIGMSFLKRLGKYQVEDGSLLLVQ